MQSLVGFSLNNYLFRISVLLTLILPGCSVIKPRADLPSKQQLSREQLTIYSDFHLPEHHRLIENLVGMRYQITNVLDLPTSDEPIHVYMFENEKRFKSYLGKQLSYLPDRRAFFIKNDTRLTVFAFWGDRVAEDLRHEVTHGYLHSVIPAIPLWIDEGLAEYFEAPQDDLPVNQPHIRLLAQAYRSGSWRPDLARLENVSANANLTQMEYAEAWLWIHFLLNKDADTHKLICDTLSQLKDFGHAAQLTPQVEALIPNSKQALLGHLKALADGLH